MHLFTPVYDERSGRYCGPTAMCAVTGLQLSEVKAAIRQASGKITDAAGRAHRISGVANKDLLAAMSLCGWHVCETQEYPRGRMEIDRSTERPDGSFGKFKRPDGWKPYTFDVFLRERGDDGPFIVNVTGHYLAAGWGEVIDPFNPIGVDIEKYLARKWGKGKRGRYQHAHVQCWWKFEQAA